MKSQYAVYQLKGTPGRYAIRERFGPFYLFSWWMRRAYPSLMTQVWHSLEHALEERSRLILAEEQRRANRSTNRMSGWLP